MKGLLKRSLFLLAVIFVLFFIANGVFAATAGYYSVDNVVISGGVSNPSNAFSSDNNRVRFNDNNDTATYSFGTQFSGIPAGATIQGIIVDIEGYKSFSNSRNIGVVLLGGSSTTSPQNAILPSGQSSEDYVPLGGTSSLWGVTWSASSFRTEDNFKVKLTANNGNDSAYIDHIQVQVTYSVPTTAPTVTTTTATSISTTTAIASGNVTSDGGASVTERGIQVSTTGTFLTYDTFPDTNVGTGSYSVDLTDLNPYTMYYYRAYATNSQGTSYGNTYNFTTRTVPTITNYHNTYDRSGHTITVGNTIAGDTVYYSLDNSSWSTTPISITNATISTTIYVKVTNTGYEDWYGSGTVIIDQKKLNVTGITANNKIYNGNTTATLNLGSASLSGIISGDTVTLNSSSYAANFADKNVGNSKSVTVSGLGLSGTQADNYTLIQPTGLTADITAKELTISGLTANDKVYDGNSDATLDFTSASLVGIVDSEDVSLDTDNYTADFSDRHVGMDKDIIVFNIDLLGADKDNYSLTLPDDLKADITAKTLTVVGAVAQDKIYDGTTDAVVDFSGASLDGIVGGLVPDSLSIFSLGDDVTLNTTGYVANFSDPAVGTDKDVSVIGLVLEGEDKDDYSLVLPLMLTANITPQEFTVTFNGTDIDVQIVLDGNKIVKPADPVKSGYTFGGWYADSGLTTPWNFDTDTVTGDMTLYPKWIKNASASVIPQTGQYALLIVSGILVATGFGLVALNKKSKSK